MVPVSEAYRNAVMSLSREADWQGAITTRGGETISFGVGDLVEGSGKITRQICAGEDIEIGSTCAAQLDLSLHMPDLTREQLYGAEISLAYRLKVGAETWEAVPLGTFTVTAPPSRSLASLTVQAYDAMTKFDRKLDGGVRGTARKGPFQENKFWTICARRGGFRKNNKAAGKTICEWQKASPTGRE